MLMLQIKLYLNIFMLWLLNYAWGFTPIKNLGYFDLCDRTIELHHMLRKGQHVNAVSQTVFEQFYALAA